jgi:hypothetical protein
LSVPWFSARDASTREDRWRTDAIKKEYFYREHTPFAQLVDERSRTSPGSPLYTGFYLNNSILDDPNYFNGKPDYHKYYNAVIVLPVTSPAVRISSSQPLWGFLCADSMNGRFDMHCVSIMRGVAAEIYEVFDELRRATVLTPAYD